MQSHEHPMSESIKSREEDLNLLFDVAGSDGWEGQEEELDALGVNTVDTESLSEGAYMAISAYPLEVSTSTVLTVTLAVGGPTQYLTANVSPLRHGGYTREGAVSFFDSWAVPQETVLPESSPLVQLFDTHAETPQKFWGRARGADQKFLGAAGGHFWPNFCLGSSRSAPRKAGSEPLRARPRPAPCGLCALPLPACPRPACLRAHPAGSEPCAPAGSSCPAGSEGALRARARPACLPAPCPRPAGSEPPCGLVLPCPACEGALRALSRPAPCLRARPAPAPLIWRARRPCGLVRARARPALRPCALPCLRDFRRGRPRENEPSDLEPLDLADLSVGLTDYHPNGLSNVCSWTVTVPQRSLDKRALADRSL